MGWSFIGNVVLSCDGEHKWIDDHRRFEGAPREHGEFYAELLGTRIIRDDWIKVGKDSHTYPQLAFDGIGRRDLYRRPQWPNPECPQQLHMDITVPDVELATALATRRGAVVLADRGDSRTLADPFGHPFCLSRAHKRRIRRIVLDCFSPRSLAPFYERLLDMHRVADDPHEVEIARVDGGGPNLAFQHVPHYVSPRWGDDRYHQQVHLDIWFEDPAAAANKAEELGGILLHRRGHPVFADPAGHPFCLLSLGQ